MRLIRLAKTLLVLGGVLAFLPAPLTLAAPQEAATPIEHFVVVMMENHTFDNYFGTYPGADGIPPDTCMPEDPDDPDSSCVRPFHISGAIEDLDHSTDTFRRQYNDGRMDGFVAALNRRNQDGRLAMGYYDDRDIPYYWNLADEYVLFDRFFSSDRGGSLSNHMFWVAGRGSDHSSVPEEGFEEFPTIFDRLEEAGISWRFYVQNYDPNITFRTPPGSEDADRIAQVIWNPLLAMPRFVDDPQLSSNIVHLDEYFEDLANGTLPAVSYIIPSGASEHPPGSLRAGQQFTSNLIHSLMRSRAWDRSAFMVTYDDWGGWYDHVPPPQIDEYGYGFRVPTFMVSPYARHGHVDSTTLDFASVPRFIQENWGLEPLAQRDRNAKTFTSAFDFDQEPRPPRLISHERGVEEVVSPTRSTIYVTYSSAFGFALVTLLIPLALRRTLR